MRHVLDHTHEPGRHCASTSVADLLRYHGIPWGEALCFGIGGGLGIWYAHLPGMSPSRVLHARSMDFERRFFERIGMEFAWQRDDDPAAAEFDLKTVLAAGRPALLLTDIYYLPYYRSQTHFPGHCIIAWGYDDDRRVFYVSDTEREGVLPVPFDDMRTARVSTQPVPHSGDFYAPAALRTPRRMDDVITEAIIDNARQLASSDLPYSGIDALETLKRDLADWGNVEDWQWTARFMYQIIEKRGTGGGGFRLMYADFLSQAIKWVPRVAELKLAELMLQSGRAWQELAGALKVLSEQETADTSQVTSALTNVIDSERRYVASAMQLAS
ncbi:MAG: BtrH N-terminal domain-containing protein [Candidatus Binatia bacterium]|jgi:hypothetical protein